ncbi:MAG: flagellar motor switch protein FliN [Pseudomonadota bacterium]
MSDDTDTDTAEPAAPHSAPQAEDTSTGGAAAASATPFDDINSVGGDDSTIVAQDDRSFAGASDLEAVFDVPVKVSAILGRSRMDVAELLKLAQGSVVELDRKVGEAIDIYVNDRLVARGEVVLVEDRLGVTMTEIIQTEA